MRAITEMELREMYKKSEFTSFTLPEGCRLTPAAAQFLSERRIKVVNGPEPVRKTFPGEKTAVVKENNSSERSNSSKPEHMTHIRGNNLVLKNHPRIRLRGKLDSFEALLITSIIQVETSGYLGLGRDLRELLDYVRRILAAEVKGETLPAIEFNGWSQEEIRQRSHNPQKYFGVSHLFPDPEQGAVVAQMNYLRTQVREVELAAIDAFCKASGDVEREDIIQALNRLSSLLYVLTIQLISGHYRVGC